MPSLISVAQEMAGREAPGDFRFAVGADDGLAFGSHLWHPHLHQHIRQFPGELSFGMIAIMRDVLSALHAGLDQAGTFGELFPLPVDLHI